MANSVSGATSGTSSTKILQDYIDKQKKAAEASSTSKTSTSTGSTDGTASSKKSVLAADMNTFLKILTTQLQNQDPTQATDVNAFTQELVQFSQVEQSIQTNENLEKLIAIGSPNGVTPLLGYVGKTVEAQTDGKIAVQSGTGNFTYTLDRAAQIATVTIKDSAGKTVSTFSGETTKGEHKISWPAKDSATGKALADGTYTVSIAAKDINGENVTVSDVNLVGVVSTLETASDGTATLSVGDISFKAGKIVSVYSGITTGTAA